VVVGLAGNTENEGLAGAVAPEYYVIRRHNPEDIALRSPNSQRIRIVARSPLDAHSVAREIGGAVARLDASLPVNTTTLKQAVYRLAERPRFSALLLSVFAAMGVLLACAGIYALVSLLVGQSAHEIAIHMALGAKATAVTRRMVFQACISMGIGALAGTSCSLTLARWMNALLFGIKPTDPATLAEAALALLALGMLAAYIPARRAARVDPMDALRYE
jgi:predicted lysophospholipase L1 biosynthesis ABC-type transport system permease subunit